MSGVLVLFVAACGTLAGPEGGARLEVTTEVLNALKRYEHAYLLQPGDQLEVHVYRHPEFSRKSVVRADGMISLPLLNEVKAAGQTPRELAARLNELFSARLKNVDVSIIVENPPEPTVYLVGQIGAPRAMPLRLAKTVAQALAQSGDATRLAAASSVSVIRLNEDGFLEAMRVQVSGDRPTQAEVYLALNAVALKANDLIVVPESYRSQIVRALTDLNTLMAPLFNVIVLRDLTR